MTLLVWHHEEHLSCKNCVGVVVNWLSVWSEVQIVYIWSNCHPQTPSPLASFKSGLVLLAWYWRTQVFLEKKTGVVVIVVLRVSFVFALALNVG